MRRLERYVSMALVDATIAVFLADWKHQHPEVEVKVQGVELDEFGMIVDVGLLVDVYERSVKVLLYSDTHTAVNHIYEELWKEASR